jgi:hypothetical protein
MFENSKGAAGLTAPFKNQKRIACSFRFQIRFIPFAVRFQNRRIVFSARLHQPLGTLLPFRKFGLSLPIFLVNPILRENAGNKFRVLFHMPQFFLVNLTKTFLVCWFFVCFRLGLATPKQVLPTGKNGISHIKSVVVEGKSEHQMFQPTSFTVPAHSAHPERDAGSAL